MWTVDGESSREEADPKSDIACHACRKRKIRCGRELPHCKVCEKTTQVCVYPDRILKPGPKIGSTHRPRKRRREDRDNEGGAAQSPGSNAIQRPISIETFRKEVSSRKADNGLEAEDSIVAIHDGRAQAVTSIEVKDEEPPRNGSIKIHDLSFILHPAHEVSNSDKHTALSSCTDDLEHERTMSFARASHALNITQDILNKMIKMYFDNMTAINLFHEPTFQEKLQNIGSTTQTHALLAAILSFSARFCTSEIHDDQDFNFNSLVGMNHKPAYFMALASKFIDEALKECGDEAPPLCVLQALSLLAHCQLTQGVRGKAWRSLGTCVRLAYELNLHLVDAGNSREALNARQWCENEEKRRLWWAIWEMDVFASTVRRCPTAVDWSQIETLLPAQDEDWFRNNPQESCFLERDQVWRWKALQESGNQSPKAWFIVINSLMKDAQSISSPRGIPNLSLPEDRRLSAKSSKDQKHATTMAVEAREKLETLSNSVHCFTMALPSNLRYRNQFLSFDARQPGQIISSRQYHCGVYNIHVMTQLSKLMIHHFDIFAESSRGSMGQEKSRSRSAPGTTNYGDNISMHQYFEAADEILRIVHRSSADHIRHINAFLASTIWLASAVQLVRKEFGPSGTNRSLVKSKYEVLNMTYKKCVSFWDIQTAMQQNLETIESQLELLRVSGPKKTNSSQSKVDRRPQSPKNSSVKNGSVNIQHDLTALGENHSLQSRSGGSQQDQPGRSRIDHQLDSITVQARPIVPNNQAQTRLPVPVDQNHGQQQRDQLQVSESPVYLETLSPPLSELDFMHMPSQQDKQQISKEAMSMTPSFMDQTDIFSDQSPQGFSANAMQGFAFGMHTNGWNTDLSSYLDKLLSGAGMY